MISRFKTVKGLRVLFGSGTTRIRTYLLQIRPGAQVALETCLKSKIGQEYPTVVSGTSKVVLEFKNVESLNEMIEHLQSLKAQMEEQSEQRPSPTY